MFQPNGKIQTFRNEAHREKNISSTLSALLRGSPVTSFLPQWCFRVTANCGTPFLPILTSSPLPPCQRQIPPFTKPSTCWHHFLPFTTHPGRRTLALAILLTTSCFCVCILFSACSTSSPFDRLNSSSSIRSIQVLPSEGRLSWCHCPTSQGSPFSVMQILCSPPSAYYSGAEMISFLLTPLLPLMDLTPASLFFSGNCPGSSAWQEES